MPGFDLRGYSRDRLGCVSLILANVRMFRSAYGVIVEFCLAAVEIAFVFGAWIVLIFVLFRGFKGYLSLIGAGLVGGVDCG